MITTDKPRTIEFEAEKEKYYSLQCFADGPRYEFYSIVKKYTEGGVKQEMKETPKIASGIRRVDFGFKADTKITEVEYVVTYTNQIIVNFNTPQASEGILKVEYYDPEGNKRELSASGNIPVGSTDLILTLTPTDPTKTPTVKYSDARSTEKTLELIKTGNSYRGTIEVKNEDLIEVNITISFGRDEVLITFIPPSETNGTLKITYKEDGEDRTLTTTGNVLRGTELHLTVTKKDENKKLIVNAKKEGEEAKPITMTQDETKAFVGSVMANSPLTLTFRFEEDTYVDDALLASIAVYPTPFTDRLYITSSEDKAHFELFNGKGQLLERGKIENGQYALSTSELPAGLYLVVVSLEGRSRTFRVVK